MTDRLSHWQNRWTSIDPERASWHQAEPALSLALIEAAGVPRSAGIVDIGGGDSVLVDRLLERGRVHVAVLDVAPAALARGVERLGPLADDVVWIESDVLDWRPVPGLFELWHDRACFHFLTDAAEQRRYAEVMATALTPGGIALIAGFAPDGPDTCSGLPVARDQGRLDVLLAAGFALVEQRDETHRTPAGGEQAFRWWVLRRL